MTDKTSIVHWVDPIDSDIETWTVYSGGAEVAKIKVEILEEAWEYEFEGSIDLESYEREFPNEKTVKIDRMEVNPLFQNMGHGGRLLDHAMEDLRSRGYRQWFLNASPLETWGLKLNELESFYGKRGFKPGLKRQFSTLMWFHE